MKIKVVNRIRTNNFSKPYVYHLKYTQDVRCLNNYFKKVEKAFKFIDKLSKEGA